ncbi:MAG: DUF3800 domain-containing protein [Firmicutes bacterium]|nr:DUF3800 domain-containing protein [Bacillota bacterium]
MNSPTIYVFADEAGNFDFSVQQGASRYFILTTVTLQTVDVLWDLVRLRWQLGWEDITLDGAFHASTDRQDVRNRVYDTLVQWSLRIDATILEKRKALPKFHDDPLAFYRLAWWLHWKYVGPRILLGNTALIIAGTIAQKKKRAAYETAVADVVAQVGSLDRYRVVAWDSQTDVGVQVADYCAWAIQRKWERNDTRSYDRIAKFIQTEYDIFAMSNQTYY